MLAWWAVKVVYDPTWEDASSNMLAITQKVFPVAEATQLLPAIRAWIKSAQMLVHSQWLTMDMVEDSLSTLLEKFQPMLKKVLRKLKVVDAMAMSVVKLKTCLADCTKY